jgi:peptidoglycan-binding protein CsiV
VPTPFTALPSQQREFRGKAAYMQRRGLYSTLFHQSWLQQVPEQAQSLPIVIDRSGDSGQWPRLQGSVKLYLSRYLHLETNLWLNTHGDYLPGNWQMPAPPLGPPSLVVEDLSIPEPLPGMVAYQDTGAAAPTAQDPVDTASPTAAGEETAPTTEAAQPEEMVEEVVEEIVEEGPVYPWRHAVLLQQKRRMRSNEVHYIDHPLLGIVIKITPVSTEELRTYAQAEAAPTTTQAR